MRKKLGEVLREAGLIDELQLEAALGHQRQFGGHLGRILIDSGFLTEQQLVETLSTLLGVPRVELARRDVPADLLAYVPLEFAEKFLAVPVALRAEAKGEQLFLAMSDPTNLEAVDTLQFKTGKRVVPMIAAESEVEGAIRRWYYGERPREIAPRSLDYVQFPGREVETKPAGEFDDIPVITGSSLVEVPPAETPSPLSGDWFLGLGGDAPRPAMTPATSTPGPSPAPSPPPTPPVTLTPTPSSPFAAAPPAPVAPPTQTPVTSSPFAAAPPAPPTINQPTSSPFAAAPSSREELFGAPNSFLGRDDDTGLGQRDARAPTPSGGEPEPLPDDALVPLPDDALTPLPAAEESPPPQGADPFAPPTPAHDPFAEPAPLPVAKARLDDDGAVAAELKPLDVADGRAEAEIEEAPKPKAREIVPLALDEGDDTPLELASAADFLHGGPSLDAPDRGLALDDEEDAPLELASAAEMIAHVPTTPQPRAASPDDGDSPLVLATAAELAQLALTPEPPAPSDDEPAAPPALDATAEPASMPGFEDLRELTDLAVERLAHLGAPGLDPDVTADLDVGDAGYGALAEARARALADLARVDEPGGAAPSAPPVEGEPAHGAPHDEAALDGDAGGTPRPLPPPGGVVPDDGDVEGAAPIEVVNMPPDRRPVAFEAVAPAPKAPSSQDPFGDPLEAGAAFDGEMEALDIEGSVFDADSGEIPLAGPAPAPPAVAADEDALPLADADDVEITADLEVDDVAAPPPPLLSAHAIHDLERRGHDGTTTLSAAGLVDTPERVAGGAHPGEVMTLALPTPAFSHASMVDAPWRLAGEPAPVGRGPTDVPLAPFGLASSRFAIVDDVASLAPPELLARLAAESARAEQGVESGAEQGVALPGAASPMMSATSIEIARAEGFALPDTMPAGTSDGDQMPPPEGLADAWRDAAESQLLHRAHSDDLQVPERRRALEAPEPTPEVEAPKPLHPYLPSGPAEARTERPPWTALNPSSEPPASTESTESTASPEGANGASLPDVALPSPASVAPEDVEDDPPPPPALDDDAGAAAGATPLPVDDWSAALDELPNTEITPAGASLPSATPRSVLVADAVHLDEDLTPESSPPQLAPEPPPSAPGGVTFAPTPTMITRMDPEELRALAERLVQRGALTADDIDAARKAKEAAARAETVDDGEGDP